MLKKSISLLNYCSKRLLSLQKLNGFDWKEQEKLLMEPFEYIQRIPGKHHRMIAPAFNHWLQVPQEKLDGIQEAMQTLVSWTILLDDIQDGSAFRYGIRSAHQIFGVGLTINAASHVLLIGENQISALGHPSTQEIFSRRIEEFFHGQGCDIYWRNNYICPTEEAHIDMIKKKTGSWFVFPVELMQLFSTEEKDYIGLAMNIGIYYEILDGYYNLFHPKALERLTSVKQDKYVPCSDITECKITLAIIHASQFSDVANELGHILRQRTSDPKLQNRFISLLKKHGSDEYTRNKLNKLEDDIRTEIAQFGGNPELTAFMDDLTFQKKHFDRKKYLYS